MKCIMVTITYVAVISLLTKASITLPFTSDISVVRVIGGDRAGAGQFPFAAAIHVQTENSSFFCGGSLLSPRWIVTAGHCVQNAVEFIISLGSNSLTEDDMNRVLVSTHEYYLHPEFDKVALDNDVGLIELRQNVEFSDYIGTIHLPVTDYFADISVTAIGWGQVNDKEPGPVEHLNFVRLVTLNNDDCRTYYGSQITDNMICVSGQFDEGICTGDSGSPLIYFLNNRHPIIVGVALFHSGFGCESVEPSGFLRIYPYTEWILDVTNNLDGFYIR